MPQAKGALSALVMDYETTFKANPSPKAGKIMPFNTFELKKTRNLIDPATIRGGRNPIQPAIGRTAVDGALTVPLCYRSIGYWMKAIFGAPDTTDQRIAGYLTGATGVTDTLGTWTAISDGSFKVTINGSEQSITSIDLSGASDMAGVAAAIQAKIRAVGSGGFTLATVAWQAGTTNFKITSGTTGAASSVSALSAASSGTDISGASFMKCHAAAATATAGVDKYSHVFKVTDAQPSLVLEKGFTDIDKYFLYNGCKIGSFKLPFGDEGELVASMDIIGAKEAISDSEYDSSAVEVVIDRVNAFQAEIFEAGVSSGIISSGEINFGSNLDGNQYVIGGGGERGDIPEGVFTFGGTLKTLFTDTSLIDKGANATETSIELKFTSGANKSLSFKFNEVLFDCSSPAISGPAGVMVDLNYRAYFGDDAGASAAIVTLVNDVASF